MSVKTKHVVSTVVTQINNGLMNNLEIIEVTYSFLSKSIASLLVREGFIKNFFIVNSIPQKSFSKHLGLIKTSKRVYNKKKIKKNIKPFFCEQVIKSKIKCVLLREKNFTKRLFLELKYFENKPSISSISCVSKSSKNYYISLSSLWKFYQNNFVFFLSTNKGVLTSKEALRFGIGGKVLIKVF